MLMLLMSINIVEKNLLQKSFLDQRMFSSCHAYVSCTFDWLYFNDSFLLCSLLWALMTNIYAGGGGGGSLGGGGKNFIF